jgi:spore coat polysaccharide biosynthesis protein SpsF (cytidylyltransferase family)
MLFGIIIQARTGSSRFPEKILKKIDKRTVIEFLIDNLLTKFKNKNLVIATTNLKRDSIILKTLKKKNINFFRGSEENVLNRYLNCAQKFKIKNIIQITSDCPLVDVNLIIRMKKIFFSKNLDYLANTYPPNKSTYPDGTDIEIYKYKSLLKLSKLTNKKEDKEHVTNFFWKSKKIFKTMVIKNKINLSNFKFSIDYKNELTLIKKIVKIIKKKKIEPSYQNIIKIIGSENKLKKISDLNLKKFKFNRKDLY